jgi:hypothetical protein
MFPSLLSKPGRIEIASIDFLNPLKISNISALQPGQLEVCHLPEGTAIVTFAASALLIGRKPTIPLCLKCIHSNPETGITPDPVHVPSIGNALIFCIFETY